MGNHPQEGLEGGLSCIYEADAEQVEVHGARKMSSGKLFRRTKINHDRRSGGAPCETGTFGTLGRGNEQLRVRVPRPSIGHGAILPHPSRSAKRVD